MAELNLQAFIGDVGRDLLQALLDKRGIESPEPLPPDEKPRNFGRAAVAMLGRIGDDAVVHVEADLDRCLVMSDEAGELSLYDVAAGDVSIRDTLEDLTHPRARALHMLVHHENLFREAEYRRHGRHYFRSKKYWSRYKIDCDDGVLPEVAAIERSGALREALQKSHPDKRPVEIEVSQAVTRPRELMIAVHAAQATRNLNTYEKDKFVAMPIREASTSTILFDAATGFIDIAGKFWRTMGRDRMARAFVEHALGLDVGVHRVRPAGFDLSQIALSETLEVDPEDEISDVRLSRARFRCGNAPWATHTWEAKGGSSVWAAMEAELGPNATQRIRRRGAEYVELVMNVPKQRARNGVSSFTVSLHHDGATSLKEVTRAQELIMKKYLPRWGVRDELDAYVIDDDVLD